MSFDNTYIHCGKAMKMSNKYNVFASLLSAKPEDAGMIAAWMADREAEKDMMNMEVVTCRHDATCLNEVRGDYDGNISVGDVRILSKQFTSEPDVIPYVAVLEEWEKGMWLIAPFSHYATPATPGEMSTGIDMRGLRVLQAWNGRTVQDDILKKSFLFDRLSDKVRADALALFRHEMGGVDLPTSFSAQRGVPIVNEADPRREYIAESIDRLQPLAEAVMNEVEGVEMRLVGPGLEDGEKNRLWEEYGLCDYALAAATSDVCPSVPLVAKKRSWKGNYREVSGFEGFMVGDEPRPMKFYIEDRIDDALLENGVAKVEAYKKDTRQLVGTGQIMIEDGEQVAKVKIGNIESPVSVGDASEIVLVLV